MISILKEDSYLLLRYEPDMWGDRVWVLRNFLQHNTVRIRRAFHFERDHFYRSDVDFDAISTEDDLPDSLDYIDLVLGKKVGTYFKIDSAVLNIGFDLFFDVDFDFTPDFFVAHRDTSIWPKLDKLGPPSSVYIGGAHTDAVPQSTFMKLLKKFPNSYELNKYVASRISSILRDDLDLDIDAEALYEKYMSGKSTITPDDDIERLREFEISKLSLLGEKLSQMLQDEGRYTETQWQHEILGILRLLFPKYIHVFREGPVIDKIFKTTRSVDFLLVDYYGNIDIVEIKKPKDKNTVSSTRYRDNHIPLRELSGTIMQIEKYIYHLNRSAERGEKKLLEKYGSSLPKGFEIKITNPKGIIIMGRDRGLSTNQLRDFEIIKRKYSNVIDIITYDDLIRRIRYSIEQLQKLPLT